MTASPRRPLLPRPSLLVNVGSARRNDSPKSSGAAGVTGECDAADLYRALYRAKPVSPSDIGTSEICSLSAPRKRRNSVS